MRSFVVDLAGHMGQEVSLQGWVHNRRELGGISFLILRDRTGIVQCVFEKTHVPLNESCVRVTGKVVVSKKAPGGLELHAKTLRDHQRSHRANAY